MKAQTYVGLLKNKPDTVFLDMDDPVALPASSNPLVMQVNDVELEVKMTFPAYTIAAACFWGEFLLTIFMVTGLVSIPFGLINSWRERPRPMSESQFRRAKEALARQVDSLLKVGRKLYDDKLELDGKKEGSGFKGIFKNAKEGRSLNKQQHEFEVNCILTEKEFYKLQQVSQYRNKVEPCKYACYLILGVITGIISFIIHIHFYVAGSLT